MIQPCITGTGARNRSEISLVIKLWGELVCSHVLQYLAEVAVGIVVYCPAGPALRGHHVTVRREVRRHRVIYRRIHPRNVCIWAVPLHVSLAPREGLQIATVKHPDTVALPVAPVAMVRRRSIRPWRCSINLSGTPMKSH